MELEVTTDLKIHIEAIKIVETPVDIFKVQGSKVKIIEGKDIDDFLASIKD